MVSDPIQQSSRESLRTKYFGPRHKRRVTGQDDRALLIALTEDFADSTRKCNFGDVLRGQLG